MADILHAISELLASKKHGGATYGGNAYGGQKFGGQQFGGNRYGALPPPPQPVPQAGYAEGDVASRPALPAVAPPPSQQAPAGATPQTFTPQAPGQVMPPGDLVDAQTAANTQVPPMGAPAAINGAGPGAGQGSIRQDLLSSIIAAIKNNTVNGQPPAWAQNFGNFADQQKT